MKAFLFFCLLFVSLMLPANDMVRTLTFDENHLATMRRDCRENSSELFMSRWATRIRNDISVYRFETPGSRDAQQNPEPGLKNFLSYREYAMQGVLRETEPEARAFRQAVYRRHFDPSTSGYLRLASSDSGDQTIWDMLVNDQGNCEFYPVLTYTDLLMNMCMEYDAIWYMPPDERHPGKSAKSEILDFRKEMFERLTLVAEFAYRVLESNPDIERYCILGKGSAAVGTVKGITAGNEIFNNAVKMRTHHHNALFRLTAVLGLAGCLLKEMQNSDDGLSVYRDCSHPSQYIERADSVLFHRPVVVNGRHLSTGFLDLNIQNSGVYQEGGSYSDAFLTHLNCYFSTLKRVGGSDHYTRPVIETLFYETMRLTDPFFSHLTRDDCIWNRNAKWKNPSGVIHIFPRAFYELIGYFYQGSEKHIRDGINYYYEGHKRLRSRITFTPSVFYSYNPAQRFTDPDPQAPDFFTGGSFSTCETTVMQERLLSGDFESVRNRLALYITHENSMTNAAHEHSDQTSFSLFYRGRPILIDPGYRPSEPSFYFARDWMLSPYAHNLILVNPSLRYGDKGGWNEADGLAEYRDNRTNASIWATYDNIKNYYMDTYLTEPIGLAVKWEDFFRPDVDASPKNPAYRIDASRRPDLEHVAIECVYDHLQRDSNYKLHYPKRDDIQTINRHFYMIDAGHESGDTPCVVIYDEIKSSNHQTGNIYANQLHFSMSVNEPDPAAGFPMRDDLYIENNDGRIKYSDSGTKYTFFKDKLPHFLYGATGCLVPVDIVQEKNLPVGTSMATVQLSGSPAKLDQVPMVEHRMLRIKTKSEEKGDVSFLTVLLPSVNDLDPQRDHPVKDVIQVSGSLYGVHYVNADARDVFVTMTAPGAGDNPGFRFGFSTPEIDDDRSFGCDAGFSIIDMPDATTVTRFTARECSRLLIEDPGIIAAQHEDIPVLESENVLQDIVLDYSRDSLNVEYVCSGNAIPRIRIARQNVDPRKIRIHKRTPRVTGYVLDTTHSEPAMITCDARFCYINYKHQDLVDAGVDVSKGFIHLKR